MEYGGDADACAEEGPGVTRREASGDVRLQPAPALLSEGRLVLEGTVPSYHMKQIAQTLVSKVADEAPIDNQIVVDRPARHAPRKIQTLPQEAAVA